MELWIVGQYKGTGEAGDAWEFQGVFSSKEQAVQECRNKSYFIAPATLNESFGDATEDWPGCYYPITSD